MREKANKMELWSRSVLLAAGVVLLVGGVVAGAGIAREWGFQGFPL